MLEDFHTIGRMATKELIELVDISSATRVLDAGCGIGGTSRFIADRYGCHVTAVDLTGEFSKHRDWLNRLVGLDDRIVIRQADITALPFADAGFDVVVSQHVQMNVFDKAAISGEASRVLVRADGSCCGTSSLAAVVSRTIHYRGLTFPNGAIWSPPSS